MNPLKNKTNPPNATPYAANLVHSLPRSQHYRYPLENLLGTKVVLEGKISAYRMQVISGFKAVTFLCLKDFHIKNGSSSLGVVDRQSIIDHMWIICDEDYVTRNNYKIDDTIRCTGTLYEYSKNGLDRNISMILHKSELVTKDNRDLLKPHKTGAVSDRVSKEIQVIRSVSDSEKAKRNRKKVKKQMEHEILFCLERFIEEQDIREFFDLSREIREANPDWYPIVVEKAKYIENFIESYARSKNQNEEAEAFLNKYRWPVSTEMHLPFSPPAMNTPEIPLTEAEPKTTAPVSKNVTIAGKKLDLNVPADEVIYRGKLNGIVNTFMNNNVTCKNPHQQTYVIADSSKLVAVMSPARTALSIRGIEDIRKNYSYIDICYFISGSFEYHHFSK